MRSWVGILVVFVGVIALALFLRVAHPALVLVVFLGVGGFLALRYRNRAREEIAGSGARVLGLKSEVGDPFGLLGYPFELFGRATEGAVEHLLWGTWQGVDVKQFDFTCAAPAGDGERRSLACAIAPLGRSVPPLVIEPESLLMHLAAVGQLTPVAFEPGRFARIYSVRCDDESFARSLLDEPMREWLADLGDEWAFEVGGPVALVYAAPRSHPDVITVLMTLKGFLARLADSLGPVEASVPPLQASSGEAGGSPPPPSSG